MTTFSREEAELLLDKLEALITKSGQNIMGVITLTPTHRLRFCYSEMQEASPLYVGNKWRQTLRLTTDEFADLCDGALSGSAALAITRQRLDL